VRLRAGCEVSSLPAELALDHAPGKMQLEC
jgi:hypothetical protein